MFLLKTNIMAQFCFYKNETQGFNYTVYIVLLPKQKIMKILKCFFFVCFFLFYAILPLCSNCLVVYTSMVPVLSYWLFVMLWLINLFYCQSSKCLNHNVKFNYFRSLFRDKGSLTLVGFTTHIIYQFILYSIKNSSDGGCGCSN